MADEPSSNQQRILDAAKRLFLTKGYNGSNLRDIAREAKVSMGGIYHHFASKQEIYQSLLTGSDVTADMLNVLRLLRNPEFPDNLADVGDAIALTIRKHKDTFKLFYIDVLEFEGRNVNPLIQRFRDGFRDLGDLLLAHKKDQLVDLHPALIIRVLLDVFIQTRLEEAVLGMSMAESLGLSDEEITRQIARLLLEGLIKRT
ncbi:MAG: TetR/AcrR family transcriptional regulator [Deltaproteobacteria bacterium]|nr:MAG: TetR/AcrR family transcriptional regulator [Deltaproteobacteria bacterium]